MKAYWGSGGIVPLILWPPALDGGEWSVSRICRFTPRERSPVTRWIWGWVGPRAVLNAVVKRKFPSPPPEIETFNPDPLARSLVAKPTKLSWLFPSTDRSPNWSLPFRFSDQIVVFLLPHAYHMSRSAYTFWFVHHEGHKLCGSPL
jgi:hypothetical protein